MAKAVPLFDWGGIQMISSNIWYFAALLLGLFSAQAFTLGWSAARD